MSMIRLDNSKLLSMAGATMLLLIALSPVSAPKAQGLAADFSSGSVIIGEDADACDNSKEGGMRYNSASGLHQFCNGLGWAGFVANPPSVLLGIIPSSNFTMDVIGPGNPAYGATETFTVKNFGTTTSSNLTVDLTESADQFDIMSDACTGVALAEGQTCDITIRPKSTANALFSGTLTIPQNNIPMAPLKGVAQGFGCAPGVTGGGGVYAACGAAYNLVAVPGGCTDSATPTCAGGTDSTFKVWGSSGLLRDKTYDSLNGPQNNVNLMAYVAQEGSGAHLAAEFCRNMAYGGFSDWYLPSDSELLVLYGARSAIGGWASGFSYWSSTQIDSTYAYTRDPSGASVSAAKGSSYRVRCVRRETQALPAAQYDLKPDNVFFTPAMTTTGNRVSSNLATISGVSADISVAIANDTSGGARIKINGGAEVTSGTAGYGDTIQVVMTAPGSAGNANTVDVALGENTARWKVGVPNETGTRRVFVSESSSGGIGGANSGDARCQSEAAAAGLGGTWQAMISELNSATNQAALRMDFNWDTIVNMNGQTVATSWGDLWDGSIANPVNYDENGVLVSTTTAVYTGTSTTGVPATSSRDCSNWLSTVSTTTGTTGLLTGTNGSWIANTGTACNNSARLYCFEQVPGPGDTTPDPFSYNPMTAQAAASTVDVTAASVVISGINAAAGVSVSGSGNPEYRINAGSWTSTSGTLNNGDTLTIRADAPASNGARNKVTITAGTYTTYWYVGAGDTGLTRRIFVRSAVDWYGSNNITTMDGRCAATAAAAGLGSNWAALASENVPDGYAVNKMNANWGTLKNLNGDIVANSWEDLWDGSLGFGVGYDENYQPISAYIRTATLANGRHSGNDCLGWTTTSSTYWSTTGASGSASSFWIAGASVVNCYVSGNAYCVESGSNADDELPNAFYFHPMTAQGAPSTADVVSSTVNIDGIGVPVSVNVSGSGNPEYRINSGAWTSAGGTISRGDTLTVRADAPATANQRNKVTVTVGTYTTYWYVGAGNTGNTKRIFVTATTYNGNRAGLGGADSTCSSLANAAGLGTGWVALMSDSGADGYAINRAPLNWGTLTNMNGDVVAASWADLWDGSVSAPINRSQTNTIVNNFVWTATGGNGRLIGTQTCLDWTTSSNSNSYATRLGSSGSSGSWVDSSQSSTCDIVRSLYCIEQ